MGLRTEKYFKKIEEYSTQIKDIINDVDSAYHNNPLFNVLTGFANEIEYDKLRIDFIINDSSKIEFLSQYKISENNYAIKIDEITIAINITDTEKYVAKPVGWIPPVIALINTKLSSEEEELLLHRLDIENSKCRTMQNNKD